MPVTRMAGKLSHLEPLLDKCILLGIQIVIVHDEQDSKTGDELERIVSSANSELVSLVTKSLFSPGKARNLGIKIATADWICFWDSDDNPIPESFFEMVSQAKLLGHEVAAGKFRQISGNVREVYGSTEAEIGRMPGIWRFAFKRESIKGQTFPEYRMGEDQVFLAKVLALSQDYLRYEDVVYEYICDNPEQLTKNGKVILELRFAIEDMLKIITYPVVGKSVALTFLSKQILTLLKYGTPRIKLRLTGVIAKGLRLGGYEFLDTFLKEFYMSLIKQFYSRRNHQ